MLTKLGTVQLKLLKLLAVCEIRTRTRENAYDVIETELTGPHTP